MAAAASRTFFQGCCTAPSSTVEPFEEFDDGSRSWSKRSSSISPAAPMLRVPAEYAKFDHRIQKELSRIQRCRPDGVRSVEIVEGNIRHWKVILEGPSETPYAGGLFHVEVGLPVAYPFATPEIYFVTPIYHVNVCPQSGYVCGSDFQWESASTIAHLLEIAVTLLTVPDPPAPRPANATKALTPDMATATVFHLQRAVYEQTAREWTQEHAKPH